MKLLNVLLSFFLVLLPCEARQQATFRAQNVTAAGGGGTFAIVHSVADRAVWANHLTCTGTGCTLVVPSTGSSHGYLAFAYDGSGNNLTAASGGGTWTVPASCAQGSGPVGEVSCAYVTSSSSGTTSLSFTFNGTVGDVSIFFWEYSWSGASISFDNCWKTTPPSGSTTTITGPTLTLSGGTEVVGSMASADGGSVTAASAPYNTNFVNQDDVAGATSPSGASTVLNTPSNTASSWTVSPAATWIVNACALKGN